MKKNTLVDSGDFLLTKTPDDGTSGNAVRPLTGVTRASSGFLFGGRMSDEELKVRTGEWLLECQRVKLQAEGILRKRELTDRQALIAVAMWIAILILTVVALFWTPGQAHAYITEASYFTYASCIKEGTSGIMANGRKLDDESLVCASWDYRLGTRLVVRNLDNDRIVLVTVADRGPSKKLYRRGRKLDLSRRAFQTLADGRLDRGLLQVEVKEVL